MMTDVLSHYTFISQRKKTASAAPDTVAQSQSVRLISESISALAVLLWTRTQGSSLPVVLTTCSFNKAWLKRRFEPFDAPWKGALRLDTGAH